jgi:hypothetical protein
MAARGSSPRAEPVRIETESFGVRPQPANGHFAVLDLGGKNGVLA